MMNKFIVLDTETRNDGFDVKKDNKDLLACQLGNDSSQDVFYRKSPTLNFEKLPAVIDKLLRNDTIFVGYYIDFDLEALRKFLGIEIPRKNTLEIMKMEEMKPVKDFKNTDYPKLEDACKFLGIDVSHKDSMDSLANDIKLKNPQWKQDAFEFLKGIYPDPTEKEVSNKYHKKAFGWAIIQAFDEFEKTHDKNSLFYKYAAGDVVSEFKLFKKLRPL